jgi:hypothetical protein
LNFRTRLPSKPAGPPFLPSATLMNEPNIIWDCRTPNPAEIWSP